MKKLIAKMGAITTALIITFATPLGAMANTGGGIGGGGSGGSLSGAIHWKSIAYDEVGRAYDTFLDRSGWDRTTTESQIRGRVGNLEVCKKSKVIWYINHNAQQKWVFNYGYTGTHGSSWNNHRNGSGTIESPHVKIGRIPTTAETNAFKQWDRTQNGHKIDQKPGYTIICSGAFMPLPPKVRTETSQRVLNDDDSHKRTAVYAYSAEIKPQPINGQGDPVGEANLHPQRSEAVKTNFGELWDRVNKGEIKLNRAQLDRAVDAALEKDKQKDHGSITLDETNKTGMAEGGILNVYEYARSATITTNSSSRTIIYTDCTFTRTWNSSTNRYNPETSVCKDRAPIKTTSISTVGNLNASLKNTGFYQIISVHNNSKGFKNLVKSDGSIKITGGGSLDKTPSANSLTRGTISASAVSKKYDRQPSVLDFGDASNPDPVKAATAKLGFYDKEAAFVCSADGSTSAAGKNGANTNVQRSGIPEDAATYGAKSSDINSNDFQFYRDNDENHVRVDLWYPQNTDVVKYDGSKASSTTVSRWNEGTPYPQSKRGGDFTMKAGDEELFTGNKDNETLKNWNDESFSNRNATVLDNQHTDFTFSSTWASEGKLPQVVNVKYGYAPTVSTQVYGSNFGFGKGSSQKLGSPITVSTEIQGSCFAKFGGETDVSDTDLMVKNTGTGTKNELDGAIAEGVKPKDGSEAAEAERNLVVKFVRGTTA